jgi:hypothetical protein
VAYNFQAGNNKIKQLTKYESVTQRVLFGNVVFTALMYGRIYDVIPQNGDCSRESKIIGHGNPDNNLESPCISLNKFYYVFTHYSFAYEVLERQNISPLF